MVMISELVIGNPNIQSFKELEEAVRQAARDGEMFLQFDIKPDFQDTPRRNWEIKLETAFYWAEQGKLPDIKTEGGKPPGEDK